MILKIRLMKRLYMTISLKMYNSQLFISVFNPKQLLDYVIDIAVMVGLFVAVPIVLFLLPVIPQWILLIYCIAVSFICIVV